MWLSLVERLLWEQDAAGSNPVIPTNNKSTQMGAFVIGKSRKDLKGACKKSCRGQVFPRHSSVRRRASPFTRTTESLENTTFSRLFSFENCWQTHNHGSQAYVTCLPLFFHLNVINNFEDTCRLHSAMI